jgi:selenocysteine lyase/cysteine desulfurase
MSWKEHFSRFVGAEPKRLHLAAHSHHPWPDVSFEAQQQAWLDAAAWMDQKWDRIFDEVIPEAQRHVAMVLGLPDPTTIAFAPNTHELVMRLLSTLPRPTRILTTDSEFHSFARQASRLEEQGLATVTRIPLEPLGSFPDRFARVAAAAGHNLVYLSHVAYDSGYVVPHLARIVGAVPDPSTAVVIDGYHGFMALPTDLGPMAGRAFYTAGGYKYAMAGEGACHLHCPPGYAERPVDTGWLAGFGVLEEGTGGEVSYPPDGARFLGATFDPTGLYRFNAVQRWLAALGSDVAMIHDHVVTIQEALLDRLTTRPIAGLDLGTLLPDRSVPERGHFLTFSTQHATAIQRRLLDHRVIVDARGDRIRIGLGIYHDPDEVELIHQRLAAALD